MDVSVGVNVGEEEEDRVGGAVRVIVGEVVDVRVDEGVSVGGGDRVRVSDWVGVKVTASAAEASS